MPYDSELAAIAFTAQVQRLSSVLTDEEIIIVGTREMDNEVFQESAASRSARWELSWAKHRQTSATFSTLPTPLS